jgi:hypothetical protein
MTLQVFTAGQTLTAAQMNTLQASTYNYPLSTVSGTTYTVESDDVGHILVFTSNANPVTVTVPASLSINNGDSIEIVYGGTGSLSISGAVGVTINSEGSLTSISSRWGRVSLVKTAADTYLLSWMTSITEAEISAGSVTEGKIGTGAVTSAKLGSDLDLNGTTEIDEIVETVVINETALTGTVNIDAKSGAVHYFTSNSSANWTWNFRGDGSTTLNSMLDTGQSMTFALFATNGANAYKPTSLTVDTTGTVSVKWFGGNSYPSGNASSVDCYTVTIVKTAADTYTAFASQSKFA